MRKKLERMCAGCGRKTNEIKDGLCTSCYSLKNRREGGEQPSTVTLVFCECGNFRLEGQEWKRGSLDETVERIKSGNPEVNLVFRKGRCPTCANYGSGYYEAILQIRGSDGFVEDMIRISCDLSEKLIESDMKAYILSVEKTRNGMNIRLGSKRLASRIVRFAKRYKCVEIKYSKKLKTRKKDREVYRYTYLIREVKNGKG